MRTTLIHYSMVSLSIFAIFSATSHRQNLTKYLRFLPAITPNASYSARTTASVQPTVETEPVPSSGDAADDICIWIHPTDVSQSTIIGTDKRGGGLAVYNLDGSQIQFISSVEPNNVDLRYNFSLGGVSTTLVCFSEENKDVIGIYKVDPVTRTLIDVAAGKFKPGYSVYGFAMYLSTATGKYYCYVTSQSGTVQQWELSDNGAGKVRAVLVRKISVGSQAEGVVADDILGNLYIAEEDVGVWKYGAEPNDGNTRTLVDGVGINGRLNDDVEGLTIYYQGDSTGYLIVSSQGADEFVVYTRKGSNDFIAKFEIVAGNGIDRVSDTDGIDVSNFALGPLFPQGVFVAQDGTNDVGNQNFKLAPWEAIAKATTPSLVVDTSWDPRLVKGRSPDAPSNLGATSAGPSVVDLAWIDNSANESGFKIERKTGVSGAYAEIATVGANVTKSSDTGLAANTSYFYRVRAFNGAGNSAYSNEAAVTTPAINQPPVATITQPQNGQTFTVGQALNYAGAGMDPEDGTLPAANFTWYMDLPDGQTTTLATGVKSGSGVPQVAGNYTLRLEVTDDGGLKGVDELTFTATSVATGISNDGAINEPGFAFMPLTTSPWDFVLFDAYPNPFNPTTAISFQLSVARQVELGIYNMLGQKIRTLLSASLSAGKYTSLWDGRDENGQFVSAGIFFYILRAGRQEQRKRMVLLK